jgi:hypothetical protein
MMLINFAPESKAMMSVYRDMRYESASVILLRSRMSTTTRSFRSPDDVVRHTKKTGAPKAID